MLKRLESPTMRHALAFSGLFLAFAASPTLSQDNEAYFGRQFRNLEQDSRVPLNLVQNYRVRLAPDGESTFGIRLQAGVDYSVVGVCDAKCLDLHLTASAPGGAVLAEETRAGDAPVVRFTARSAGLYAIKVKMADCWAERCEAAFRLYTRRR